ncbi:TonB-dependent receptor [Sphingomonas sp. MG17]|uniref:TonB-dependent receptor n=1 Tax=Sphingomonas tagetis TaxID=2949092 RepID=A0A9X2HM89_9SPHN|nr:TonB-dependent receptor [Sphingomonas tagetis]MCP3732737.1 TonB-dependent receptor [Sphingomonas tagetis]
MLVIPGSIASSGRERDMQSIFKVAVMASTAPIMTLSSGAFAQESAPSRIPADEEIVVTAQKREQRLLDVPVAVSAVAAEDLIDQNLVSIRDFYTRVPGIQLSGNTTQDISLRGINAGGGTNPTVAILIDDVQFGSSTYLGRPPIPDLDPATLQRVEVLRGPQGTLYGASSLGGLIKYVTRDPSSTEWSGRAEIGVSSVADGGEGWSARGALNVPILADRIGASISAYYRDDPRYIDSITPAGTTVPDANRNVVWGGRAAVTISPVESLTLTGSALIQRREYAGSAAVAVCAGCSVAVGSSTPVVFDPRTVPNVRTVRSAVVPGTDKQELYTARATLDLGDIDLVSISAWGHSEQLNTTDSTSRFGPPLLENPAFGSPYPAGGTYLFGQPIVTYKFTQELRLQGVSAFADYLVGAFYTNERSLIQQTIDRTGAAPNVRIYDGNNASTYGEKAVFGDVTLHLGEKFDLQLGGRYAANEQTYRVSSTIAAPAQPIFGPGEDRLFTSKEDAITWLVTPTFRLAPDMMLFARVASGYRPGGPNTQTPGALPTFGADTVINYELGFKGQFADHRVTIDASVFQIDWKDIQLQNTALPSQFVFFVNGKKARSRGIEFTGSVRPWEGMTIDANATLLDAALTQTLDRTTTTAPIVQRLRGTDGDRLPYSAKFTGNIGAQQSFAIGADAEGSLGFNVNHVGDRYALFNQDAATARIPRVRIPAYTTVDLRASLTLSKMWKLNAFVQNLFDQAGITSVDTRNGTQLPLAVFSRPRTIGLNASVTF